MRPRVPRSYHQPPNDELAGIDRLKPVEGRRMFNDLSRWFVSTLTGELQAWGISAECDHHCREAFWTRGDDRLNWANVTAYQSPEYKSGSPWIPRISVNCLQLIWRRPAGILNRIGIGERYTDATGVWQLELSCLPEELLDFPAWVAELAGCWDRPDVELDNPPHGIDWTSRASRYEWTPAAWAETKKGAA